MNISETAGFRPFRLTPGKVKRHLDKQTGVAEEKGPASKLDSKPYTALSMAATQLGKLDMWVVKNSSWLAIGIVAAAFALRLAYSASCILNPDEAFHFLAARPTSWLEAYRASRFTTHPPLFILILHWTIYLFGRTELILRMPSIAAGTAALWLAFAWIRRVLGHIPALAGIVFLATSPAAISGSTEVRQYGLLLCFLCGALYATERAFDEQSTRWAIVQGLFLLCALETHYIALVPIAALDVYVLLRCLLDRVPRRILLTFVSSKLVLAAVVTLVYFRQIRHSEAFNSTGLSYLSRYFYDGRNETFLSFLSRTFFDSFEFLVGAASHPLVNISMLVFLAGLVALLSAKAKSGRLTALLIVSPFAVGLVASLAHVFPFAGTRHQAYLLPFLAAGLSAALLWIPRRLATVLLLLAVALAPFWALSTAPDNDPRVRSINDMNAAMDYLNWRVPPGAPLFVDEETRLELSYYLGRGDASLDSFDRQVGNEQFLAGHRIVSPKGYVWAFSPGDALSMVNRSAHEISASAGGPVWIVSVRWPGTVPLASLLPATDLQNAKAFGTISIVESAYK